MVQGVFYREVGRRIRLTRQDRSLTLEDLSSEIYVKTDTDISANLISMWERGERRISLDQMVLLCQGLECSLEELCPTLKK